jgi:ApaG protein
MVSATTAQLTITVEVEFLPEMSVPYSAEFMFAYHIRIFNGREWPVQILGREWHILDGPTHRRQVRGAGIVGLQPVIAPGSSHAYTSYCNLTYPCGNMQGTFVARQLDLPAQLVLEVPKFSLFAPQLLN